MWPASIVTRAGGTSSAHPGRTEVIHLLISTRQQAQAVTHPSTNWGPMLLNLQDVAMHRMCHAKSPLTLQHFMSHNIYYVSHTIDTLNLYEGHKEGVLFTVHEENKGPFTIHEENKSPITVHEDNKHIYSTYVVNS